jgi:hypothetical protein
LKGWILTIGVVIILVAVIAMLIGIYPFANVCGGFETVTSTLSNGSTTTMVQVEMAHPCNSTALSILSSSVFIVTVAGGVALSIYGAKVKDE